MKISSFFFLALFLLGLSASSHADTYEPVPHCYKPSKPLFFASRHYKDRYRIDVEEYQSCLKKFIQHQELAAKMHTEAAQNALKTWNDFAEQQ